MLRAIRNSSIVAVLIGGALGAGMILPAARSQPTETLCGTASTLDDGEAISSAEVGADGGDDVRTTPEAPTAVGLGGADCLRGRDSVADTLIGGDGSDELRGFDGADDLSGGGGSDTINAGDGDDHLAGGDGDNHLVGGSGDDVIMSDSSAGGVAEVIYGGDGADQIFLSGGKAEVWAGDGDDVVVAANGWEDEVDCGGGTDQALVEPDDVASESCEEILRVAAKIRKPG